MAAHRAYLTAWVCVAVALLGCAAPALARPQLVPDEAALTEYVAVLPGAEGPLVAGAGAVTTSVAPAPQDLPPRVDGALSRLAAGRASALRRLATDQSLGAPVTPGAARPDASAALTAVQPSTLSALTGAVGDAPTSAMVLAVLLVLGVAGAAAVGLRGRVRE